MDPLLTTEEVAEFFRLDVVTVRRMIAKKELTAYRIGGEYRLTRGDLEDYLQRQKIPARTSSPSHLDRLTRRAKQLVPSGAVTDAFERFTQRAQSVLALAQEEAHTLHHSYLGTEHLLLGVLREGEGMGATLLHEAGCNLNTVRQAVQDAVGAGPSSTNADCEMPLTGRLKQVLEFAAEESKRLGHASIGTEHLLLGLLREGDGIAGRILGEIGMNLKSARNRVQEMPASHEER